jgi:hypothetical protein
VRVLLLKLVIFAKNGFEKHKKALFLAKMRSENTFLRPCFSEKRQSAAF